MWFGTDNWDRVENKVAITIYDNTVIYKKNDCVFNPEDYRIYYSLIDNNVGGSIYVRERWGVLDNSPVGTIKYFAGEQPYVPWGYLLCDGSAVSRTSYAALFSIIGTTYGAGNRSTTFNIPNLINRFPQGSNTPGNAIEAGLPNITGSSDDTPSVGLVDRSTSTQTGAFMKGNLRNYIPQGTPSGSGACLAFDASNSNTIYGRSTTVQPPALTLLPIIRY